MFKLFLNLYFAAFSYRAALRPSGTIYIIMSEIFSDQK